MEVIIRIGPPMDDGHIWQRTLTFPIGARRAGWFPSGGVYGVLRGLFRLLCPMIMDGDRTSHRDGKTPQDPVDPADFYANKARA